MTTKDANSDDEFAKRFGRFTLQPATGGISSHALPQFIPGSDNDYAVRVAGKVGSAYAWEPQSTARQVGIDLCLDTLRQGCWAGGNSLPRQQRKRVRDEIGEGAFRTLWRTLTFDSPIKEELSKRRSWGDFRKVWNCAITAFWCHHFEEPFSKNWVAACALFKLYGRRDEITFGFLCSELAQKISHEEDAMRGAGTVSSARRGGHAASQKRAYSRNQILLEMSGLIHGEGQAVMSAARKVARRTCAASPEAIRRLWYRHQER
ncbi:hypothetical protein [Defluviimonas salinarum]|uniref:Uncharacterized protein n=1 Tax=Defluviimonas salinarum TaxID=2992147 RepID=A0ABT3J119_9RHOB|nr:hypothetical protein [Defluviimonas salinarum]MCW3781385.1 hypothetical protein [Defluviimonas salinarum]